MIKANRKFMLLCLVAVLSMAIYGCSGNGGSSDPTPPAGPTDAELKIKAAQDAAAAAAMAAMTASGTAADAVTGATASRDADLINYGKASLEAGNAATANAAAQAANTAAQAAGTVAAAQEAQAKAEAAAKAAAAASTRAMTYAGMVAAAQKVLDDAAAETLALTNAKTAAMTAATAARKAADDAQTAADKVAELLGGDTKAEAVAAQEAATAADTAADAAKAASDRAEAAATSTAAEFEQATATDEQGKAEAKLVLAKESQRQAQLAADAAAKQEEDRKIDAAQKSAEDAAMSARAASDVAKQKVGLARTAADHAQASAGRAVKARTDSTTAKAQATAAETAVMAAETAATAAETAATAAETAQDNADLAATSKAAETSKDEAEAANVTAKDEETTAVNALADAQTAETNAAAAANLHVLGLFEQANAYDIIKPILDDSSTKKIDEAETVAEQRTTAVNAIGDIMAKAADVLNGNQAGDATVTATWDADTPAGKDTPAKPGLLTIISKVGSVQKFKSDTVGKKAIGNDKAIEPNAEQSDDGGDFQHMFDISSEGVSVIAFTDREQTVTGFAAVPAKNVVNSLVTKNTIVALTPVAGGTSFTGKLDEDENPMTPALSGTFTCADPTSCSVEYTGTGDSVVVNKVNDYKFTGSRAARAKVKAVPNKDYLVFGLWLNSGDTKTFGAFGTGGETFDNVTKALMGTATYTGEAVGAHHETGSAVSWFDGDAKLTAKFGSADEPGTIEGSISNISVNGGAPMSDSIYLVEDVLGKTFKGDAIMGAESTPGKDDHAYNGTWSGGFFNEPAPSKTGDPPAASHPRSVAGTFGVTRDTSTGTGVDKVEMIESFVGAFGAHKD